MVDSTRDLTILPYYQELSAIVEGILLSGVNFIALDFDFTLLDIHTRGQWNDSSFSLIPHVRPIFKTFIILALQRDIHVAMVTFSTQTDVVTEVLHGILPHEYAPRVPIRGEDNRWNYQGIGCREGKQKHMASAAEYLQSCYDVAITRSSTLLIDDEVDNITTALNEGVRAVHFDPTQPDLFLVDMATLFPCTAN